MAADVGFATRVNAAYWVRVLAEEADCSSRAQPQVGLDGRQY